MNGIVTSASNRQLDITLTCPSACSHCEAKSHCGFSESQEKKITIECDEWQRFQKGDPVTVTLRESQGLLAVLIAYILPTVLGLVIFFLTYGPWGELASALATLSFFGVYLLVLRLMRNKLQHRFEYSVKKIGD